MSIHSIPRTNKLSIPNSKSSLIKKQSKQSADANRYMKYDPEKEPIKAYLRIRPPPDTHIPPKEDPYITVMDNTEILLTAPQDSHAYRSRHRDPEKYRFTRIFQDSVDQETFYNETTLDLVKDVLHGHDALIFAYGVTNSGKTYTVMGQEKEKAGILPRALNTIFSSIQDFKGDTKFKPYMHSLLQPYDLPTEENRHILTLDENIPLIDPTDNKIEIDPNFEYNIWVSFIEIYNEQIYDLLDTSPKRKQLGLKYEQKTGNRYVADTHLVKVKSIQEAHAVVCLGQQNRQVFSTLMNQSSSRSHSVFTIHVVRCPIKDNYVIEDPQYARVSKFSVVDLAGSERYRNTNSTGQRLKEAGNINKSLMVLGQCMEVLRMNQIKAELGKKNTTPVPFRHSKLTELFKNTFEGHGKAAIVVNVNPFDTGFDENIHVMRFSAVAKDVSTWRQSQPKLDLQDVQPTSKRLRYEEPQEEEKEEQVEEVEDEDDQLVDGLIGQLEEIWEKWMEAESRATNLEFEIREQVSREMNAELKKMEDMYISALKRENEMMNIQLKQNEKENLNGEESSFLKVVQERQNSILEELENLKSSDNLTKQTMMDRISELERRNKKERERSEYLLDQLNKQSSTSPPSEDEDEGLVKEAENDPKFDENYNVFLDLRKQLRRTIFKREELGKDADEILTQVEQFDGVSFKLAKETQMGKLLKLITQEDFEKDPYMIQSRAMRLFKKYAQLPTSTHTAPRQAFSNMSISDDSLRAENIRLKRKVKNLTNGQKRLKEAFEKTRMMSSLSFPEDTSMKDVEEDISQISSIMDEEDDDDEYESDIAEILKPQQRHKRRRKLRERS